MKTSPSEIEPQVRPWHSIGVKLVAGLLILTLAAGVGVWMIATAEQERLFREQHVRYAGNTAIAIAHDLVDGMLSGGGAMVWNSMSADAANIAGQVGAARIVVFTGEGRVVAASDLTEFGANIQTAANPECPRCDSTRAEDFPAAATVALPGGGRGLRSR